jgi:predicted ATPase
LAENTNLNWAEDEENFVGRRIELYQITSDLDTHRCVALHGLGGMGKTALARAAGRWQHERRRWKDGVWEVLLREVNSAAAVRSKIVEILSEESLLSQDKIERARDSNSQLARSLKNFNMLLILDDLDQLIEDDANELFELLIQLLTCRQLKLLVTSRGALRSPKIRHHRREIQGMKEAEAVEVFRKYAPPEEEWNGGTDCQEDFDELIGFLEGYPMPIKLAASYLQDEYSSLSQLKEEIWRALRARDYQESPDRDTSLDITLEVSYRVLPIDARDMFPLLALFPGGISEELAACIRGDAGRYTLRTLLRFSMAEKREGLSTSRITLPEPARRYAETKLLEGIKDDCYLKALEYLYSFAQDINQSLGEGEKLQEGKKRLLEEQANLHQCLEWG